MVKNENGEVIQKKFDFSFQLKFLFVFFFKFLSIVSPDQSQKSYSFYRKKLLRTSKKVLDECSSTLEFYLVKCVHILFLLADDTFSSLTENTLNFF